MQTHHRRRPSKSILIPRVVGNADSSHLTAESGVHGSRSALPTSLNAQYLPPHYYPQTHPSMTSTNIARRMTVHLPETIPDHTYFYGYILLTATFLMFTFTLYSIVASQFMPDTQVKILDWIKYDDYYCLLLPITAVVWFYWVLWNWMGMKFFRHN